MVNSLGSIHVHQNMNQHAKKKWYCVAMRPNSKHQRILNRMNWIPDTHLYNFVKAKH